MPIIEADSPSAKTFNVSARGSIAVELEWALAAAGRDEWQRDHPTLGAVYEAQPELLERVKGMWGPDVMSCFMELMVLAHRGGHLLSEDAEALLEDLPVLCTETFDPADYPMIT